MHIGWSYTKFCWKKCVLENLCFFLLDCLLKIASFYSDVAVVFVLKAVKKRITFFIGNQIRHDVYQKSKSFKCSVYQRYFLDLSRIIFLWSCGHFSKPHFVLKLKIRTFCDAAFSFYDHCRHIYTCYKKMETCFEFVFLRAFQWTNRYLILGILKPSKS